MKLRLLLAPVVALLMTGCGEKPTTMDEFRSTEVLFPGGQKILAEMMRSEHEISRGMMFRQSLRPDRGMLFFHGRPGNWTYYMFQVEIPLDIVWLDGAKRIVEMSPNTPPCTSKSARECPVYGGKAESQYVLELAGGQIENFKLKLGDTIRF